MAFKNRSSKKVSFRKKRAPRRKAKGGLVTKSQLYRAIRRSVETKVAMNAYPVTAFNSNIGSAGDFITLLPQLLVGTGENGRIGGKVNPIKLVIRGYVSYSTNALANDPDARMLGARLMVLQDKGIRCYTDQNSSNISFAVLNVGGTSSTYTGTPTNWCSPANHNQFKIFKDKRMKFMKPFGFTNNTTPSATNAITAMNNTLFQPFTITLTKKQLPATLFYDANESLAYPTNFAPYIALGYSDLLNATPDTVNTQLNMTFNAELYYEDA